ncbi:MAG TPA: glutaminyl-peptide cyclotransferase [Chitinophagaceae bacterium]|nr:glutaminyl-peptide cyclotransferase [Chitinophagaceae bacterium]
MKLKSPGLFLLTACLFAACNGNEGGNGDNGSGGTTGDPPPPIINYSLVKSHPHDTANFIQGLEFHDGVLYESTGSPVEFGYPSWLGKLDLTTGKFQNKIVLDTQYFAEGLTVFNGKLYQLTWQNKKGFVYDPATLKKLGEFSYNTEGWGLTHDSASLIMSDGSSNLYFLDPVTYRNQRIVGVSDQNGPVGNLNELEYIDGFVYANQWQTNYILKIDPNTGKVVGKLDLSTLVNEINFRTPGHDYLNGIAYNPASGTVFVTGKRWSQLYEIKF